MYNAPNELLQIGFLMYNVPNELLQIGFLMYNVPNECVLSNFTRSKVADPILAFFQSTTLTPSPTLQLSSAWPTSSAKRTFFSHSSPCTRVVSGWGPDRQRPARSFDKSMHFSLSNYVGEVNGVPLN